MKRKRHELERLIADWVEERSSLGEIPLPASTPEAELLRLLRAAESETELDLSEAEARTALERVLDRARANQEVRRPPHRRIIPQLGRLALAGAVLGLLALALWPPASEPPPRLEVVKQIRFELVQPGRVVLLELTAYGPEPLRKEASNDTSAELP